MPAVDAYPGRPAGTVVAYPGPTARHLGGRLRGADRQRTDRVRVRQRQRGRHNDATAARQAENGLSAE
jgi:hypothetical protein